MSPRLKVPLLGRPIANSIGIHASMVSIHTADELDLSIEDVDAISGTPMGRPKSGTFSLGDMVGIDIIGHVANTTYESGENDPERDVYQSPEWVKALVESGRVGRKAGAGFYKKVGKDLLVLDRKTGEYRAQNKTRYDSIGATKGEDDPAKRIKTMIEGSDKASEFAWKTLARSLCYSARLMGEIADDVVNVDRAIRWGFNWDLGPFEIWDAIGVKDSVARMQKDGFDIPGWIIDMVEAGKESFYSPEEAGKTFYNYTSKSPALVPFDPRHIRLDAVKEDKSKVVLDKLGASLLDIGDGVVCLEVHTKMNTIDQDVIDMLFEATEEAEKNFEAMVIGNDGAAFGAGANLMLVMMAAQQKAFDQIEPMIKRLQYGLQAVRHASIPVVSAPHGLTLGGGAEIAMAADATVAYAETYMGLVEVGVGLVPGGGGCLRLVERFTGPV
ncbi:MAG: 3-hydroxyacyl-CoA dehydrogenase family protein, partial [Myxococcota bacterium]